MNITIFAILLFFLQGLYWIIGRSGTKNLNDKDDYFLAKRKVRFFPLMMTFLATLVGGGVFLGAADEAYQFGWFVILYPIGAGLGLIVLGLGIGKKLLEMRVSTVAQIFETVYQSKRLKQIASLISIFSLFLVLIAQIVASHKFLIAMGITNIYLFILFWGIVIIYTSRGGLKAVISTDMAQAGVFTFTLILCFVFTLFSPSFASVKLPNFENFSLVSSKLYGWLLMPFFFIVIGQDIAQRCFAGGSAKIVSKASLCSGIFLLTICSIPIFFGVLAKTLGINIPPGSSVLMTVIAYLTNPWITALVGCAILAAIISTATSVINSISSNIINDFEIKTFNKISNISIIRGTTLAISIGALVSAFHFNNIIDLLIQSYELLVSSLFISIFIALFKKKGNVISAWCSVLFGILGFVLFRIFPLNFPREILSICLSLIGFAFGEILSRNLKPAVLDKRQI